MKHLINLILTLVGKEILMQEDHFSLGFCYTKNIRTIYIL